MEASLASCTSYTHGKKEVCLKGQSEKQLVEASGNFLNHARPAPHRKKRSVFKGKVHKHLLEANGGFLILISVLPQREKRGLFKGTVSQAFAGG
jgi:hypothetical protein